MAGQAETEGGISQGRAILFDCGAKGFTRRNGVKANSRGVGNDFGRTPRSRHRENVHPEVLGRRAGQAQNPRRSAVARKNIKRCDGHQRFDVRRVRFGKIVEHLLP